MPTLRERIDALNGWQRLWVVYSLIMAIGVISITAMAWPAQGGERVSWDDLPENLRPNPMRKSQPAPADAYRRFGDPPAEGVQPSAEEIEFRDRFEREKAEQSAKRHDLFRGALVWWLGIVATTYALGWSIGWIRNGFRRRA